MNHLHQDRFHQCPSPAPYLRPLLLELTDGNRMLLDQNPITHAYLKKKENRKRYLLLTLDELVLGAQDEWPLRMKKKKNKIRATGKTIRLTICYQST